MSAKDAIFIVTDERYLVLYGGLPLKDLSTVFGKPDPGGWATDYGKQAVLYRDGHMAFEYHVVRSRNKMDDALLAQAQEVK